LLCFKEGGVIGVMRRNAWTDDSFGVKALEKGIGSWEKSGQGV